MCLVDDDRVVPLGERLRVFDDVREGLERGDDDRLAGFECTCELFRFRTLFTGNTVNYAGLVVEFVNGIPKLFVQNRPVGDDDDAVEDRIVVGVMERNEPVNKPRYRLALPASRGVLNEIIFSRTFLSRIID